MRDGQVLSLSLGDLQAGGWRPGGLVVVGGPCLTCVADGHGIPALIMPEL